MAKLTIEHLTADLLGSEMIGSPTAAVPPNVDTKRDSGKPQWHLLPFAAVEEIIKVLMFGDEKYSPGSWMDANNFRNQYFSAAMRHMAAWGDDEDFDSESGLSHLAHAGACILFLIWKELRDHDDDRKRD